MRHPNFDVVVVGAGMFGSAAGKYLSKNLGKVAIIGPAEPVNARFAASQQSFGAYYDQARITRRLGWDEIWGTTDSRSMHRFRDIEVESGVEFFQEKGSLVLLATSIAHRTELILTQCQANEVPVERLSASSIEARWPYLKVPPLSSEWEGLFEKQMAGYLNPRKLVAAQLQLFQRFGGTLIRGSVSCIEKEVVSDLWCLHIVQNGNCSKIYAPRVLLAAGAFVNQNSILPYGHQLDLRVFTEPNLLFELNEQQVDHFQHMPTMISVDPEDTGNKNTSIYLLPPIQYPDGKWYMRIGPGMQPIIKQLNTLDEMRQWYIQQRIFEEQRDFLIQMQRLFVPDIEPLSIREACCIIEKTPSHYPYIGPIEEDETLHVVTGGNGHGARGSDEIGRLAANLTMGVPWDFPVAQSCFTPVLSTESALQGTLEYKPPFGLC